MINLLPDDNKRLIRNEMTRRVVAVFSLGLLALLLVQLIFFVLLDFLVDTHEKNYSRQLLTAETSAQKENLEKMEKQLLEMNNLLSFYESNQGKLGLFSDNLQDTLDILPADIKLNSFVSEKDNFYLRGHAATRDGLISFVEQLRKKDAFESVESPISNLLAGSDIDFSLNIKLKVENGKE